MNPKWTVDSVRNQNKFSVNVWGGIINDRVIGPFFIEGTQTAESYIRFIEEGKYIRMRDLIITLLILCYLINRSTKFAVGIWRYRRGD